MEKAVLLLSDHPDVKELGEKLYKNREIAKKMVEQYTDQIVKEMRTPVIEELTALLKTKLPDIDWEADDTSWGLDLDGGYVYTGKDSKNLESLFEKLEAFKIPLESMPKDLADKLAELKKQ